MLLILDTYELSGWRPQPMDMPLEHVEQCCCCAGELMPVAGIYCGQVVVLSECRGCGWLGYAIRPRAEWFDQFYASDWDAAGRQAIVDLSRCATHPISQFIPQLVKPPASVCDVGCGFGIAAWQLKQFGYRACGIEKSFHRAMVAAKHGVATNESMSGYAEPFDVVTAHHVLEHSVDPDAFIAEIAQHQDEGGILYISVPNQRGEPAMGCLLFLPHLHSFTFGSLCKLAERHGYTLLAWEVNGFNIAVAFRKCVTGKVSAGSVESAASKLSRAVHANGQGPLLSWCGNLSDAWFTTEDRFAQWRERKWKPRAVRAERVRGPGRFPVELEVPCLFVK